MTRANSTHFAKVKYVFLDRDGVINRKPPEGEYISRWEGFESLPDAEEAIAALNRSGRVVLVITNQRGVALGRYSQDDVHRLHGQLQNHLSGYKAHIDGFYICPHDKGQCACRKPGTGLFEQAVRDYPEASAENSVVIGDSLSDIQAAYNFGAPAIFIDGSPETQKPGADKARQLATACCSSLMQAVQSLLLTTQSKA
jgi:D-glycero-D-manno-heptose 1,7-bisphosphate phosphatase